MANSNSNTSATNRQKGRVTFGMFLFIGFISLALWIGFNTGLEATNTESFCISCHEMKNTVYQEYKESLHYKNRTGVRATCSDCHVPKPFFHKMKRKILAVNDVYHTLRGTINTPEKMESRRLHLAQKVWAQMKESDSRECRYCHDFNFMLSSIFEKI